LKALSFIIHSNIFIAFSAVALTLASQVQLGMKPEMDAYLVIIFFATLFDYNFHRLRAINTSPGARGIEKLRWATGHLNLLKTLIVISLIGVSISLFFVRIEILYVLSPLALISILYSFSFPGKPKHKFLVLKIPGLKTLLIAFVWAAVTVLVPVLQTDKSIEHLNVMLLFTERFTFIFAVAIPFDIRDMESDSLAFIKTIPIVFGENSALKISNILLLLSLSIAAFHYLHAKMIFILPAFLFSIVITFIFINNKKLKKTPLYYHGILDGCILLHGMLIFASFYITL
jgi:4-hydroxybenzoate polyprenyltransferase